jgi:hypothetical protein
MRIAQLSAITAAHRQSLAAFLVELPEAATIINRIHGDIDRCLQVAFVLDTLDGVEE